MNAGELTTIPVDKKLLDPKGKKFLKWCQLYLDNTNKDLYGNATKCALAVYKTTKYHTAAAIGHQNYKKLQLTGLAFEEIDGRGVADWFKIAASKAIKGSYEQTINFMERIGILDTPAMTVANQNNVQFNFGDLASEFTKARKERGLPVEEADSVVKGEQNAA